jgi:hypothetical protein
MPDEDRRRDRVRELLPELQQISDEGLRDAVTEIWLKAWIESGWEDMASVPKNPRPPRPRPAWMTPGRRSPTPAWSRSAPKTQEALIVRYADFICTDTPLLNVGEKLFTA